MPVSSNFVAAALAEQTGEVAVTLITLSHPNMGTPIRVTSDSVQTVSRSNTFIPYPFSMTLPRSANDAPPLAKLVIQNVDRRIVEALRALPLEPALSVLMELVLAAAPDVVEAQLAGFELRSAEYDQERVSGDVVPNVLDREPYPYVRFMPSTDPGVF